MCVCVCVCVWVGDVIGDGSSFFLLSPPLFFLILSHLSLLLSSIHRLDHPLMPTYSHTSQPTWSLSQHHGTPQLYRRHRQTSQIHWSLWQTPTSLTWNTSATEERRTPALGSRLCTPLCTGLEQTEREKLSDLLVSRTLCLSQSR